MRLLGICCVWRRGLTSDSPRHSGITDSETGELVLGTRVVRIDPASAATSSAQPSGNRTKRGDGSEDGWVVQTVTDDGSGGEGTRAAVLAKTVINAAGLKSVLIAQPLAGGAELTAGFCARPLAARITS